MAVNNNTFTVSASLNIALSTPAIGGSGSGSFAFTDGDLNGDNQVALSASPTALNPDLGGDGFVIIFNPGPLPIAVLSGITAIGNVPAGTAQAPVSVLLPVADNIIINATCASAQTIGRSYGKWTANA